MARPSKLTYEEKQTIVNDFYLLSCEKNPDKLKCKGAFTEMAQFANDNGFQNVRAYDFSRDKKLLAYIDSLCESQREKQQTFTTAFKSFDVDYFFRQDIAAKEKREKLVQLEAYYKEQLSIAENRKLHFSNIQKENNALKEENDNLRFENSRLATTNKDLAARNKSYEQYIKSNVLPEKAEQILNQKKNPEEIAALDIAEDKVPCSTADYKVKLRSNLIVLK